MDLVASLLQMQLDLYVQIDSQDPNTGALKKEWMYEKTVPCSAKGIISNSTSSRNGDKQTFDTKYSNSQQLRVRTINKINLRNKVTNIRNSEGVVVWNELNYPTETPTVFEVSGVTVVTDPFGKILAYDAILQRAENQSIGF
jgi:hypothetical protein